MKIVCINMYNNHLLKVQLTIGKIYTVIDIYSELFNVVDDDGELNWFDKKRFITYRKLKLDKINDIH